MVLRSPTPPPRPDAIEMVAVENFTIESLRKMLNQVNKFAYKKEIEKTFGNSKEISIW